MHVSIWSWKLRVQKVVPVILELAELLKESNSKQIRTKRKGYAHYTDVQRVKIGRFVRENGNEWSRLHF